MNMYLFQAVDSDDSSAIYPTFFESRVFVKNTKYRNQIVLTYRGKQAKPNWKKLSRKDGRRSMRVNGKGKGGRKNIGSNLLTQFLELGRAESVLVG